MTVPELVEEAGPTGKRSPAKPADAEVSGSVGPTSLPAEKTSSRTALRATGFGLVGLGVASGLYVLYLTVAGPEPDYAALTDGEPFRADGTRVMAGSDQCNTALGAELKDVAHPNNYAFDEACKANKRRWVALGIFWASSALAAGTLYFAYRSERKPAAKQSAAGGRKRRELIVAPVIGPGIGGATLRFAW